MHLITNGFILRSIVDKFYLVKIQQDSIDHIPPIELNEMGALVCSLYSKGLSFEDIIRSIADEYNAEEEMIKNDLSPFFSRLKEIGFAE